MKSPENQDKKPLTFAECLEKLRHFCAYQERSKRQVVHKLIRMGADENWRDSILQSLEEEDFINEIRFQQAYIRGKSKVKGWGPEKIRQKLYQELGRNPDTGLQPEAEQVAGAEGKLRKDLAKKYAGLLKKKDGQWRAKLIRFCLSRGFDWDTAMRMTNELEG